MIRKDFAPQGLNDEMGTSIKSSTLYDGAENQTFDTTTSAADIPNMTSSGNLTESLEDLNARYADALLPLTITFGVFTFLGFGGNLLILLVFSLSREYKRNNFKIFVLTLGVIDLITCVTLIPAEMVKQRHYFAFGDNVSCKIKCFFNVFGASSSCIALLIISIDRFRKVVQPLRKQIGPSLAIKVLFVTAFIFPVLLAIPGTIMCGIEETNKVNKYNTTTVVYMCTTEPKYKFSPYRILYKFIFIILLVGISMTYIILYAFVMKEVIKQIRTIAAQRRNSSFEMTYSSDICDPNAIHPVNGDLKDEQKQKIRTFSNGSLSPRNLPVPVNNGSLDIKESKKKKASRSWSMRSLRSIRSRMPLLQRQHFPSKTLVWFILTLVFVITYNTHLILALKVEQVIYMTPKEFSDFSFFFRIYFFNHMINPVVYAVFVKRFRTSCVNLIPNIKGRVVVYCTRRR